ncbi:hypothetical protein EZV62_005437 [Acer yangbiense]|uniref:Glycosyltransferase n=1 Tax=Acer yangbiense TaxID=1000413 RepID=A0A5C7IQ50_9ROSI|nr:hypothetical protein EZV62_005437 [Acer yangbiense]
MGKQAHVLVIPLQVQGHLMPIMKFSHGLAKHGIKITIVNTESTHNQILNALAKEDDIADSISLVSCPNVYDDQQVKKLIQQMNDDEKITCVLVDSFLAWNMEAAAELGIKRATICCFSATHFLPIFDLPKLIQHGVIDSQGTPKQKMVQLSPTIPSMNTSRIGWVKHETGKVEKYVFEFASKINKSMALTEWVLCNSSYDLEAEAFKMNPKILPIGPLLASNRSGNIVGNFLSEDFSCLKWLDEQATQSVIYIAFGSEAKFDQIQFQEFAMALELSNKPFLWVLRQDVASKLDETYLKGFQERMAARGLVISWAPQQRVLEHPSIACFFTHCGWNSTVEALSNGVPLLCWPFVLDQFYNAKYICEVWKVGLGFNYQDDETITSVVTGEEIKNKLDELLGSDKYKANASDLKEKLMNSIKEGGNSYNNFMSFVEWVKT